MATSLEGPRGVPRPPLPGTAPPREGARGRDSAGAKVVRRLRQLGVGLLGWVTSSGAAVLLTGYLVGIGGSLGGDRGMVTGRPRAGATEEVGPALIGMPGAVTLVAICFLSSYAGGYLAGRLGSRRARHGLRFGVVTWVWAVIIGATALAIAGLVQPVPGSALARALAVATSFPVLTVHPFGVPLPGALTALALVAVGLGGALAGGVAGGRAARTSGA